MPKPASKGFSWQQTKGEGLKLHLFCTGYGTILESSMLVDVKLKLWISKACEMRFAADITHKVVFHQRHGIYIQCCGVNTGFGLGYYCATEPTGQVPASMASGEGKRFAYQWKCWLFPPLPIRFNLCENSGSSSLEQTAIDRPYRTQAGHSDPCLLLGVSLCCLFGFIGIKLLVSMHVMWEISPEEDSCPGNEIPPNVADDLMIYQHVFRSLTQKYLRKQSHWGCWFHEGRVTFKSRGSFARNPSPFRTQFWALRCADSFDLNSSCSMSSLIHRKTEGIRSPKEQMHDGLSSPTSTKVGGHCPYTTCVMHYYKCMHHYGKI